MGNCIDLYEGMEKDGISMSNGTTSVFISILVLTGSRLAVSERQKELIVWLACQDQSLAVIRSIHAIMLLKVEYWVCTCNNRFIAKGIYIWR